MSLKINPSALILRSCPLCMMTPGYESTITEFTIKCPNCRLTLSRAHHKDHDSVAILDATSRWNTRWMARPTPNDGRVWASVTVTDADGKRHTTEQLVRNGEHIPAPPGGSVEVRIPQSEMDRLEQMESDRQYGAVWDGWHP